MNLSVRFPKLHVINSVNPSFEDMYSGKKKFELLFDPNHNKFLVNDKIHFIERNFMMVETGRSIVLKIEYIWLAGNGDLFPGFMIASLTECT